MLAKIIKKCNVMIWNGNTYLSVLVSTSHVT
uniref:Uncharacterized protein n=1 Tax=Arundo donax TaxID=35708 RepID=A0A0A9A8Y5_ARUDO